MRLFIAINLPPELREAVWVAVESLRRRFDGIRWSKPEQMHLTLKFLGEVEDGRVSSISQALASAASGVPAFDVAVGELGAFPTPQRPRVVWVGCEPVPPLELLQHGVEREMAGLGFEIEGRAFRPHVTLGRARDGADPQALRTLGSALDSLAFADLFRANSVELMQSRLGPAGATYQVVHSESLRT